MEDAAAAALTAWQMLMPEPTKERERHIVNFVLERAVVPNPEGDEALNEGQVRAVIAALEAWSFEHDNKGSYLYGAALFGRKIEKARAEAAESLNTRYQKALEKILTAPNMTEKRIAREALAPDAGTEDGAVSSEGGTE